MVEEIVVQKGPFGDKYIFGLLYGHLAELQLVFGVDNLSPTFEILGETVEPIKKREDLQKLSFIGTKTYLALDEETKVPKWRATFPKFYNDFGQVSASVLVFMVFDAFD